MRRRGCSERATLADVARLAGVSPTTYAGTVLQGILVAATSAQAELLLRLPLDEPVSTSRTAALTWVEEQQTSGVVGIIALAVAVPDSVLLAAEDLEMPVVTIDPIDTTESRLVSIGSTNWAGGRSATEHVIKLGHRRIAWIGGPLGSAPSLERFHGYQAALDSAGITPDRALIRHEAFSVEAGQWHGHDLLSLDERPTAIIAGNDEIAVGVLAAAQELGIPVPGELSVTGFDDTPQTLWTTARLTSVRQPLVGMGRMAVETVLGMADGVQPASRHLQLATTLSVRDSTGSVPPS